MFVVCDVCHSSIPRFRQSLVDQNLLEQNGLMGSVSGTSVCVFVCGTSVCGTSVCVCVCVCVCEADRCISFSLAPVSFPPSRCFVLVLRSEFGAGGGGACVCVGVSFLY